MQRANEIGKTCLLFAGAVLLLVTAWQVLNGLKLLAGYLDQKIEPLEKSLGATSKKVNDILDLTHSYVADNYDVSLTMARSSAALVKHADDFFVDLNASVNGGVDTKGAAQAGLLADIHTSLVTANTLVGSMQQDLHSLMLTANASLKPLEKVLEDIATLTETLDQQVKEGGPKAQDTITGMNKALGDLDKVIADPAIATTLKNVEITSGHLGESAKSVDIALRPLREKAALVKTILLKAAGMIKFTIPIP